MRCTSPLVRGSRGTSWGMRAICTGRPGSTCTVRCSVTPPPCSALRGARRAAWRIESIARVSSSANPGAKRPPPPLLPAPEAASFCTAPRLGRVRHFVARLAPHAASRRELSARAKIEAAAAKAEETAARQRGQLAKQVSFDQEI